MRNETELGLIDRYQTLTERLRQAEHQYGRPEGSVCLVAVSKTYPADKNVMYAHYLIALIFYEQVSDEKKDLGPILEAKKSFQFII